MAPVATSASRPRGVPESQEGGSASCSSATSRRETEPPGKAYQPPMNFMAGSRRIQ
jgi:hypothetical protein